MIRRIHIRRLGLSALGLAALACSCNGVIVPGALPVYTYRVVNVYPHDSAAFTQGLAFDADGAFYEGTGINGRSSLRKVELRSGTVERVMNLSADYFGEGITVFGDTIYQLTWRSGRGFRYDKESFQKLGEFVYPGEGWGLTHDGTHLILSDGTSDLRFLDPATFEEVRRVTVRDETGPIKRLNELEYVEGEVFANVWQTDYVARIDPASGAVTGWIDLRDLLPAEDRQGADVLNGIAYLPGEKRLFVTGKLWPRLFEIELIRTDAARPE